MGVNRINENKIQWLKLLMSLLSIFALFHWTADVLGSDRGQFGIYVGSLVVIVLIFAEKALFGKSFKDAVKSIGLAIPNMTGLLIAAAISVIMLLTIFIFASVMNTTPEFYPNWYWLVPGLFFQAGIAEEGLFRGYVFGRFAEKFPFSGKQRLGVGAIFHRSFISSFHTAVSYCDRIDTPLVSDSIPPRPSLQSVRKHDLGCCLNSFHGTGRRQADRFR